VYLGPFWDSTFTVLALATLGKLVVGFVAKSVLAWIFFISELIE